MDYHTLPLGMFSWFGFQLPLEDRLRLLREVGFVTTALWWDETKEQDLRIDDLPALVRDSGLYLENIHVPFDDSNDFWSDNAAVRRQVIDIHLRWIEDCARHQIPTLVMHVTKGVSPPFMHNAAIDGFATLIQAAEDAHVVLAIENTRREEYLVVLFDAYQTPSLGLCYDSSHDWLYSAEKGKLLQRYGSLLVSTHISDNDGLGDRHWLPGHGIVDWELLTAVFPQSSYRGSLYLEVFPMEDEQQLSPERFVERAYAAGERLRQALVLGSEG